MNKKEFLKLLSIIITFPLMGLFIFVLSVMLIFVFMISGPFIFLNKIGVLNGYTKSDRK